MSAMQAVHDLLERLAEGRFHPGQIPTELMRFLRVEDVDEVMAALPEDAREIVIAWIQDTFASGQPVVTLTPYLSRPDVHQALGDWLRRQGRYHWPRRADEPDVTEAERRLGAGDDAMTRLRKSPASFMALLRPRVLDQSIAALTDEEREIFVTWARQTFASGQPLPEPRPWKARPGIEAALVDWLRRHGLLHWP
jgi:hypothetical protein